ncbi:MAG TPA: hypothetical protein DDE71_03550 [Tenacibaculum sp.]|nr:hypothetical protein [Tenacibaculum sp.]
MQFKHPETLYLLGLLVIPIIVHLFQLQRFVKTPFTNVAFLKKIALQTRKSSQIKKWLILITRLFIFSFLIIAFAQPYLSNREANKRLHYSIYLDNTLSMQAKGKKGDLLQIAIQDLRENLSAENTYTLQTNTEYYARKNASEMKRILLETKYSSSKKNVKDVLLKMNSQKDNNSVSFKRILVSDFQNANKDDFKDIKHNTTLVQLTPQLKENLSIDSLFIKEGKENTLELNIIIKNQGVDKKNIPIAIYNSNSLLNKQTFDIQKNTTKNISFSLQKEPLLLGKLNINFNDSYLFDNTFYFTLATNEKINVLSIGKLIDTFRKIYTSDKFNFKQTSLQKINYNDLNQQQLIILNELDEVPNSIQEILKKISQQGGSIVVIPSNAIDTLSYYKLFSKMNINTSKFKKNNDTLKITNINFKHPIFANVFKKEVLNFQYPSTNTSYTTNFVNSSSILSFENKKDFVSKIKSKEASIFWFSSPLDSKNSNFKNSPLIVPLFYNIGKQSLKVTKLYYTVGENNILDLNTPVNKKDILTMSNGNNSFIPLQQVLQNKTRITLKEQPFLAGFNYIIQQKDTIKSTAFNYDSNESLLSFLNLQKIVNQNENINFSSSVKSTLNEIKKKNEVHWLWKWFLLLSIVSLLFEILILKFFKP